jgi:pyruvate dehydrogenase E1 component alpha subunit
MFKEYSPLNNKMFQVMDCDSKIVSKKWMPDLSNEDLLKHYKNMLFARTADLMIVSYQRQGRIYTYPPNYGQEAIAGAAGAVMRKDDWLVPAFREMGAYLAKGATLKEIFLYYMGYEDGTKFAEAENFMPIAVPIASQLVHAAGIGYAINYQKKDNIVYAFVGDGGTSEGDFHEALNFAAVWNAPVVFVVQNNQFAISVPYKMQTKSQSIAIKSVGYGIEGLQADGNDFLGMYSALQHASDHVRNGNGPVLIEAVTYRKGAHTTSDDPTKYRTKEEEESWDSKDPLERLKKYLIQKKVWSNKKEEEIVSQYKKEIDRIFIEAENYGPVKLDDVFDFHYADMPEDLKKQKVEHEKFLKWKEEMK